ncbi:hypothetical protein MARI_01750 [Marinobacter sp. JH2]|nr:diguanylate cyclase [Marinobacter sp. JH2]QBM16095.1 hypothetical protein MARI_01750 [Marinobacter sp. JH2]
MALCRLFLYVVTLLLVAIPAGASQSLEIGQGAVKLKHFPVEYFVDGSQSLDYESVRLEPFETTTSTATLGNRAPVAWYRISLQNTSASDQSLFLHLPKAYHVRSIDIIEERSASLVNNLSIDLNNAEAHPTIYKGTLVYPFVLPGGQSTVLYVRSHAYSHQWFSLGIYDEEHSRHELVGSHLDIALMVGMMLALVFYNSLLYFATSKKENIFYSLYLISGLVWIALSYGLVAKAFSAYGDAIFMLNLSIISMPIFLLLFMMAIFETREYYRTENRVLQAMLVPLIVAFVYGLFDITAVLKFSDNLAALVMLVTFSVSLSLLRKGHPLVKFFLVGHTFFLIFNGIAVMYYKGMVTPNYINSHGVGIGIILEALTLAFIISYRIKLLEDIRSKQDELKRQASTDPLTRLYNRRHFMAEGEYLLAKAKESGESLSVIALDIDHFKLVNDTHGHNAGDLVLVEVASTFRKLSRDRDLVARFGGEEFLILLPGADLDEAFGCAERIRAAVESLAIAASENVVVRVTVSLGVVQVNTTLETLEDAVNRTDQLLYEAKAAGRNRVSGFSD